MKRKINPTRYKELNKEDYIQVYDFNDVIIMMDFIDSLTFEPERDYPLYLVKLDDEIVTEIYGCTTSTAFNNSVVECIYAA